MKNIISILSFIAIFLSPSFVSAQASPKNVSTQSIKVSGVCSMCKKRIESAAFGIAGVKSAKWDAQKQAVEVTYTGKKVTKEALMKRIAASGHDTEGVKANDKAYGNLPECCRYRDGVEVHDN